MHVWMFDLTCSLTSTLIPAEISLDSFCEYTKNGHMYILKTIIGTCEFIGTFQPSGSLRIGFKSTVAYFPNNSV